MPWEELKDMPYMDQEAWWREAITPAAHALLCSLAKKTGRSYTDCVVGLMGDNPDIVINLIEERLAKDEVEISKDLRDRWEC